MGRVSYEYEASCLRASLMWGELSWDGLSVILYFEGVWSDGWSYKCEVGIDGLGSGWGWRLGRVRGGVSW